MLRSADWVNLPLVLRHLRVHSDGREAAFAQQTIKLVRTECVLDENDDLIVVQGVEQIIETSVLLILGKLDVVLLETMQSELSLVIDVDLKRVLHELLADGFGLVGQGCRKHHDLLLCWSGTEDLLDITAHVCQRVSSVVIWKAVGNTNLIQHLIALIEHES